MMYFNIERQYKLRALPASPTRTNLAYTSYTYKLHVQTCCLQALHVRTLPVSPARTNIACMSYTYEPNCLRV